MGVVAIMGEVAITEVVGITEAIPAVGMVGSLSGRSMTRGPTTPTILTIPDITTPSTVIRLNIITRSLTTTARLLVTLLLLPPPLPMALPLLNQIKRIV